MFDPSVPRLTRANLTAQVDEQTADAMGYGPKSWDDMVDLKGEK